MPEITYNDIGVHLKRENTGRQDAAYLVFGDGFLVEQAVAAIVDHFLPDPQEKAVHLETVDMAEGASVYEVIERINTLSFFARKKIVRVKADMLFASGFQPSKHLETIEAARLADDIQTAARRLAELMAKLQCDPRDIVDGDPAKALNMDPRPYIDVDWLKQAAAFCIDRQIAGAGAADGAGILKDAIKKGFPAGHVLVMSTASVDRRSALYKAVKEGHTAVNCSVATGARKADVDAQKKVLHDLMRNILAKHGKTAEKEVFERVFALTGFEPRVFSGNLEKLVHFSGASPRIKNADVDSILDKTREDPIFAFTGAIFEKNAQQSVYYLSSLLSAGFHAMQLLSAITSQARKLLMVRFFTESSYGSAWQAGMGFDPFKKKVMPAIIQYDQELATNEPGPGAPPENPGADTAAGGKSTAAAGKKQKKTTGGQKRSSDLAIVKNPNNPYPVYQLFRQSERFAPGVLKDFMVKLHEADIRLKTTGSTPRAVLESLIFHICMSNNRPMK